eukprot:14311032-Alexandrium_andersonii.AAC.1
MHPAVDRVRGGTRALLLKPRVCLSSQHKAPHSHSVKPPLRVQVRFVPPGAHRPGPATFVSVMRSTHRIFPQVLRRQGQAARWQER